MTYRGRFLLTTCLLFLILGEAEARLRKPTSTCNISYPSDAGIEWECRRLKRKESLESLFGDQWRDVARFNRIDRRHPTPGFALKVPKRLEDIAGFNPMPAVYPPFEQEPKAILVDLTEQFLGAYEYGRLVFSTPVASGDRKNPTPKGEFRIDAFDRRHRSSLYKIEKTSIPYPMHYALRFFVNRRGIAFWIHGRDVPGYPASHGCVGLYDEEMQKKYYKNPQQPLLEDARALYEWVVGPGGDDEMHRLKNGPKVIITGTPPM